MQMKWSLALALSAAIAIGPAVASAQLARPNASGAAIGHVHINARDVEAQSRFWTTLGGRIVQREKLTLVQFPGIYVILRKQDPTGGTVGQLGDRRDVMFICIPRLLRHEIADRRATTPRISKSENAT